MIRLIAFFWDGCFHNWNIHRSIDVVRVRGEIPFARDYELRCARCGKMKIVRL